MTAQKSKSFALSRRDVSIIKGMLLRGDRQHDIAAWYGVNGGRIAEIKTRKKFADVLMQTRGLPPPGPYLSGKNSYNAKLKIEKVREGLRDLAKEIDGAIATSKIQGLLEVLDQVLNEGQT